MYIRVTAWEKFAEGSGDLCPYCTNVCHHMITYIYIDIYTHYVCIHMSTHTYIHERRNMRVSAGIINLKFTITQISDAVLCRQVSNRMLGILLCSALYWSGTSRCFPKGTATRNNILQIIMPTKPMNSAMQIAMHATTHPHPQ